MDDEFFRDDDIKLGFGTKSIVAVILLAIVGLFLVLSVFTSFSSSLRSYGYGYGKAPVQDFTWIGYALFLFAGYFVTVLARKFVSRSKSDFALALSLGGTFLIFISLLVLLGLTPFIQNINNAEQDKVKLGWLVQFTLFLLVGTVLTVAGNRLNSSRTPLIAILSFVALPTLFLSSVFLLGFGVRDLIVYQTPDWAETPLTFEERFGWIFTFLVLTVLTAKAYIYVSKNENRNALNAFLLSMKIGGGILSMVALAVFVIGVMTFNFEEFDMTKFGRIIFEPLAYGIIGGLLLLMEGRLKS